MPRTTRTTTRDISSHQTAEKSEPDCLRPNGKTSKKRAHVEPESEQPAGMKKSKTGTCNTAKRQREVENLPIVSQCLEPKAKKSKHTGAATLPPPSQSQDPLTPRRSERMHLATSAEPTKRKRRTRAEMMADKAQAEAEKHRQEKLTEENNNIMLRMNIEEDISRAEAAAQVDRKFADFEDDSAEEFIGYNDVLGSDTDDEVPTLNAKTLKEKNKALRDRIKSLEAAVLGQGGSGQRKRLSGNKTSETGYYTPGLGPDCDSDSRLPTKGRPNRKQTFIEISAGGLEDSDTDFNPYHSQSSKPCTLTPDELNERAQKSRRDFSRHNEMVAMMENDEDEEYTPHPSLKKVAAKIPCRARVNLKTETIPNIPNAVAIPERNGRSMQNALAAKPKSKPKRINGNSVRMADLPEFAVEGWRDRFLPTLYDKFFTSDQPFSAFYKGSDRFIALLQAIIEEVYPDVKYKVTALDSIHFLAYNRINEKRSLIGSGAITALKRHIEGLEARGQSSKDWLRWARRIIDGPLFFKEPSPFDSPTDQKDPEYQFPAGRLLSPFVVNLVSSFLHFRKGSVSNNGFPKGLVALVMAALERAVKHLSKPLDKITEFSMQYWGSTVRIYYDGFHGVNGVPERRWKELLEAVCQSDCTESGDDSFCDADLSIMDNNRALVFGFCSPRKPRL